MAAPHAHEALDVVDALGSASTSGLSGAEAASRLSRYGPNEITAEKPPSMWSVALQQLRDPMNIMLVAVTVVSLLIGEVSTAVIVALLILLNVVLGTRQELKARASVDALSKLQVPQAQGGPRRRAGAGRRDRGRARRHRRSSRPATSCPPTAGSSASATLEAQEAALTGESAPDRQGRGGAGRGRRRARRPDQHAVPEHVGDPRHRRRWWSPRPACRPRWARSRRC